MKWRDSEIVALVQEKKGGPYSKDEREKRHNEVFRLHFEYGYSAAKIADLMKINRNTINADIKYDIFEKYDKNKNEEIEKYAKTVTKIIAEAWETLSNHKRVDDYLNYINVFFGKEEKDRFEKYLD